MVAVTLAFALQTIRLGLYKKYNIDEFTYAHAGWLISKGQLPYRDFFCHHFPLAFHLMAIPFSFLDANPGNIFCLRLLMLPVVLLICLASWYLNARQDRRWGLATPLLLLALSPFVIYVTEIRPDPVALALFLCAIAVLCPSGVSTKIKGFASGGLLGLGVWASEKVLVYGAVFAAAFLLDVLFNRKRKKGFLLASPGAFVVGFALVIGYIGLYLTLTHSLSAWFNYSVKWTLIYQRFHEGFPWTRHFWRNFEFCWWLFPFAAMGLNATVRRLMQASESPWTDPDLLVIGAIVSTPASLCVQRAAYPYSLMPVLAILCLFASRGLASAAGSLCEPKGISRNAVLWWSVAFVGLYSWLRSDYESRAFLPPLAILAAPQILAGGRLVAESKDRVRTVALLVLVLVAGFYFWELTGFRLLPIVVLLFSLALPSAVALSRYVASLGSLAGTERAGTLILLVGFVAWQLAAANRGIEIRLSRGNQHQHKILANLNDMTAPDDPIYDNAGGAVTRPHVSFYYFTNAFIRKDMADELTRDIPAAIGEKGCTVFLYDLRYSTLPEPLRKYLVENFQPYNSDIWIWGHRYEAKPNQSTKATFHAVREGRYFIDPPSALEAGKLRVDGIHVTTPVCELKKGNRTIEYEGPAAHFYLLWLPRNDRPFRPNEKVQR